MLETNDPFLMTARPPEPIMSRKPLPGTNQQLAFWGELADGKDDLLLEARAGTGKSTSCREGMWRLIESGARPSIRYCCFNKAIADEFAENCPPDVEVGTMHRFGLQALKRAFGSRSADLNIAQDKTYNLIDSTDDGPNLKRYTRRSIARLVGLAKNHALHPESPDLICDLFDLQNQYDVECWGQADRAIAWAAEILRKSAGSMSMVDFDDMLWLPVVLGLDFPSVDYLFIDEAQDLNPVQHRMAARLNPSGKTVVVGDPYQAIYAFRGADSQSIPNLRESLGAMTLPLTITWRCPTSHVDLAKSLVSDLEAAPNAIEGELREAVHLDEELDSVEPGELVLCRINAPLVSSCLRLIGQRRKAIVRGRSFGDSLLSIVRNVEADTIKEFTRGIDVWNAKEVERLERRDGTEHLIEAANDKAAALIAVADSCGSPSEIPGVLNALFDDGRPADRVTFSSVHRAKGSEADRVTYLRIPYSATRDRKRPPAAWELEQRRNLEYVAVTRSKYALTLVG